MATAELLDEAGTTDRAKLATGGRIQCVVVTPERTLLDESVTFVAVPLYDGELGILPRHAPMIGRLGYGALRVRDGSAERRFFVDGGFAQFRDDVLTILTQRAIPADQVNGATAEEELRTAQKRPAATDVERAEKDRAVSRARALVRMSERSG